MKNAKHEQLLVALLTSPTVRAAAEVAGIPEATAYRYLRDPPFVEEYRGRKREMVEAAQDYLKSRIATATQTLDEISEDATAPPPSRVSAARTLLEYGFKSIEQSDILQRIAELESALTDNER